MLDAPPVSSRWCTGSALLPTDARSLFFLCATQPPLQTATTDELIEEIEARVRSMVIVWEFDDRDEHASASMRWHGGSMVALGLLAWGKARLLPSPCDVKPWQNPDPPIGGEPTDDP